MTDVKRVRIDDLMFANTLKQVADNGGTLTDVADKLGLKLESVYQRYNKWRQAGVTVPKMSMKPASQRKGRQFDVEQLSSIFQ